MSKSSAPRERIYAFCMVPVVVIIAVALLIVAPTPRRALSAASSPSLTSQPNSVTPAARERLHATFAALPLAFEQNQGQTDPQVEYMARGSGYTLFLTNRDAVFSFHSKSTAAELPARGRVLEQRTNNRPKPQPESVAVVHMQLAGGNTAAPVTAAEPLPGKTNYYLGNNPRNWRAGVPQYARVSYKNVYPGVDLAYYGQQNKLEFDFIVAPNSDPAPIHLAFSGMQHIATDDSGNLVVASSAGNVLLHKPVAYQQENGTRHIVDARFVLQANNVSFDLGSYDRSRELVIDPTVTFATYLGGSGEDDGYGVAFDYFGNIYVTGQTDSSNFPVVTGGYSGGNSGDFDVFVTKLAPNGSSLIYSTYVGGSGNDSGNAIAVDPLSGNAFVAGGTGSTNFPTTTGAFQKNSNASSGNLNAFVFELNSSGGSLTYSTYLGGTGDDVAEGIAIDSSDDAYVVGSTYSANFPTTTGVVQSGLKGASNGFVTKLNSSGSALSYSTYLGGGTGDFAAAVAVDSSGNTYVTGGTDSAGFPTTLGAFQTTCGSCSDALTNAFVSVINPSGSAFVYSTFLGGGNRDEGLGIAADSSGDAYVTGFTQSSNFPLQSALQRTLKGSQNAFVAEVSPSGNGLVYSTYLGGSQSDAGTSIALDGYNNAYVTGQTSSSDFPLVSPTQITLGGDNDAFVSEISTSGSALAFSTFLGGSLNENTGAIQGALGSISVDRAGANLYVAGNTASANFPIAGTPAQEGNGGDIDAFVAAYNVPTAPDFKISATTPTAVNPGTSGSSMVTLTSLAGYSKPVNLTCSVTGNGSPLPSCSASSFSPNPQTPAPSPGASTTLTITTTGSSATLIRPSKFFYAIWFPIVGLSLVGASFSSARSRRKKVLGFLMVLTVMAALFLMPACGGSSSTTTPPPGGCTGCTPAGNYTVTILGVGTDTAGATHATSVVLTVNN